MSHSLQQQHVRTCTKYTSLHFSISYLIGEIELGDELMNYIGENKST